jgi:2-polyprenyl-3-methyl-5-hydroxy-6-metoxy-1,4-benzoquinol methylase
MALEFHGAANVMKRLSDEVLDPVFAYDRVAPFFSEIAQRREKYLESINQLTVDRIPSGSKSLLDVGAGDGKRAMQIAQKAGLHDIVLLEPSAGMMKESETAARIWRIRVEDVELENLNSAERDCGFDVITCLWNVLGHIRPAKTRVQVLARLARLLSPEGVLFLDVNHRYNARSYGLLRTAGRFLYDRLWPAETNGDVTVNWKFGEVDCCTYGHVFSDREMRQLKSDANLIISERVVVDYDTGEIKRREWEGNLFYVLRRRSSASDSFNRSQTSSTSAGVI